MIIGSGNAWLLDYWVLNCLFVWLLGHELFGCMIIGSWIVQVTLVSLSMLMTTDLERLWLNSMGDWTSVGLSVLALILFTLLQKVLYWNLECNVYVCSLDTLCWQHLLESWITRKLGERMLVAKFSVSFIEESIKQICLFKILV